MKYSQLFIKTSRETPAGETSKNAQLLIRAGFIKKEMAGVYSYLPLGLRVLRKIEKIVKEEMDAANSVEVLMPSLAPKENWEQTKRWDTVDVLFKMQLGENREAALSPTHEEIVTPLVQNFAKTYKDLPVSVYQVQTKFRNEPRAKSGLLRGREFLMKDAYSFHVSEEDFENYYETMKQAYIKIYDRLGIGDITKYVAASGGDFSEFSHEFQTLSEIGEDDIYYIPSEDRYLNKEIVASKAPEFVQNESPAPMQDVLGEGLIGVDALAKFLNIPVEKTTKTILFEDAKGNIIAAAVRGDYEVDETKLKKILGVKELKLASEANVKRVTGAEVGYAGVINLSDEVKVIFDESMEHRVNWETGTNKTHYHTINVNWDRDIKKPDQFYDIKVPKPGDLYPKTGEKYEVTKAVEVGNIFPLSTKFSDSFNYKFIDQDGKEKPVIMGCYGIGISRTMGVLAEIFADENGLVWPEQVAPFQIYLAAIGKEQAVYDKAEEIYKSLTKKGIEVLYDDRQDKKIGPGQKFSDAELMGIPKRVVVSERLLEQNQVEVVDRKTGETTIIDIEAL